MEPLADAEQHVAGQVVAQQHHALREARGARGIVDFHEVAVGPSLIDYVVGTEALGIAFVEVAAQDAYAALHVDVGTLIEALAAAFERDDGLDVEQILGLYVLPDILSDEEQLGLRVVDDVGDVHRIEIRQDGHYHRTVSDYRHVCYHPVGAVAAADGHLGAGFHLQLAEELMRHGNAFGQFTVGDCFAGGIIGKGRQIPVFSEALFKQLHQAFL